MRTVESILEGYRCAERKLGVAIKAAGMLRAKQALEKRKARGQSSAAHTVSTSEQLWLSEFGVMRQLGVEGSVVVKDDAGPSIAAADDIASFAQKFLERSSKEVLEGTFMSAFLLKGRAVEVGLPMLTAAFWLCYDVPVSAHIELSPSKTDRVSSGGVCIKTSMGGARISIQHEAGSNPPPSRVLCLPAGVGKTLGVAVAAFHMLHQVYPRMADNVAIMRCVVVTVEKSNHEHWVKHVADVAAAMKRKFDFEVQIVTTFSV